MAPRASEVPTFTPVDLTKVRGRKTQIPCHRQVIELVTLAPTHVVDHTIKQFVHGTLVQALELENTTLVPVLEGGAVFHTDLLRELGECRSVASNSVKASRYGAGQAAGIVCFPEWQFDPALIRDRHIVIIDDILDTGETVRVVRDEVEKLKPAQVTTVFLTRKVGIKQVIEPDYCLFDVHASVWAVGRGMDHRYQLRQLRAILDLRVENYDAEGWRIR